MFSSKRKEKAAIESLRAHRRRPLSPRRVDQTKLEKYIVPIRKQRNPRREVNKTVHDRFEKALTEKNSLPVPAFSDARFFIPTQEDRVEVGRKLELPRRVRKEECPTILETYGFNAQIARERIDHFGEGCFDTIQNATWRRNEWTPAHHMEVEVQDVDMSAPMPTHMMCVSTENTTEEENVLVPVHSAFLRANWARLGNLPEFNPMDVCTPVTEKGEELVDDKFARGDLPMIHLQLNNLDTISHLLAYTYQRCPTSLLIQLLGPLLEDLGKYAGKDIDWEQRAREWQISQKIAANYTYPALRTHAWFIHDLVENANIVGMEDSGFWWACDVAMRVCVDAIVCQDRFDDEDHF
ncbi:hypothetical protein FRC17_008261 [Serendipita sp. 399]|nr:hypothetical protein FRC17_008261 [Serendipita sp. 399]